MKKIISMIALLVCMTMVTAYILPETVRAQEADSIKQEDDGVTQEDDGITQEDDDITQENDGITEEEDFAEEKYTAGLYVSGVLIEGEALKGYLFGGLCEEDFCKAVNEMNADQAGSLEGLLTTEEGLQIARMIDHCGYEAGWSPTLELFSYGLMRAVGAGLAEEPAWPQPGSVSLSKTATAVSGEENLWEIELGIQSKNHKSTSDVVLVIDLSGSMQGEKLNSTIIAAKLFAEQLLDPEGKTRIAIVTYRKSAASTGIFYDYNSRAALNGEIEGFYANGGTNQQAGIHEANRLLTSAASTGRGKSIVLLTDGEPTYSYPFVGTAVYDGCTSTHRRRGQQGGSLTQVSFSTPPATDYSTVIGSGSSFFLNNNAYVDAVCKHGYTERYPYGQFAFSEDGNLFLQTGASSDNGVATIWEAGRAKAAGITVYSVALQAGAQGESVLRSCASSGDKYYQINAGERDIKGKLSAAFTSIAGTIALAATEGIVIDPMGEKVELRFEGEAPVITKNLTEYNRGQADAYVSRGELVYDPETETFSWTVGNVSEEMATQLKYRIRIKEEAIVEEGEKIDTNKTTTFKYKNYLGKETEKEFPIPQITCPFSQLCKLKIIKSGADEQDEKQSFVFLIEGLDEGNCHIRKEVVIHGNGSCIVSQLPKGNYRISENGDWSFRYEAEKPTQEIPASRAMINQVEFKNNRTMPYWLDGNAYKVNNFSASAHEGGNPK